MVFFACKVILSIILRRNILPQHHLSVIQMFLFKIPVLLIENTSS